MWLMRAGDLRRSLGLAGPYLVRAHGKVSVLGTSQPYVQQGLVLVTVPECWAARLDGSAVLWVGDRAYLADWRRCIDRIVVDAGTGSHATDGKVRSDRPSNPLLTMLPSMRLPVVGLLLLVLSIEAWWATNRPGI
jgi:hypothetical protein